MKIIIKRLAVMLVCKKTFPIYYVSFKNGKCQMCQNNGLYFEIDIHMKKTNIFYDIKKSELNMTYSFLLWEIPEKRMIDEARIKDKKLFYMDVFILCDSCLKDPNFERLISKAIKQYYSI